MFLSDVARTPSKAQDLPLGKSFVFIPFVARLPRQETLVSAAPALVPALADWHHFASAETSL